GDGGRIVAHPYGHRPTCREALALDELIGGRELGGQHLVLAHDVVEGIAVQLVPRRLVAVDQQHVFHVILRRRRVWSGPPGQFDSRTERTFPAGSVNHAINGPPPRKMPFWSVSIGVPT